MTNIKELTHELDEKLGRNGVMIESLEAIKTELGQVADEVSSMDTSDKTSIVLTMLDIDHKIIMLDSLMNYIMNDMTTNHEAIQSIKTALFNKAHQQEQKEPTV